MIFCHTCRYLVYNVITCYHVVLEPVSVATIALPFLATASPRSTAPTNIFRAFSSSMTFGCTLTMPAPFKAPSRTAARAAWRAAAEKNPMIRPLLVVYSMEKCSPRRPRSPYVGLPVCWDPFTPVTTKNCFFRRREVPDRVFKTEKESKS